MSWLEEATEVPSEDRKTRQMLEDLWDGEKYMIEQMDY